jgi:hypothetical protein
MDRRANTADDARAMTTMLRHQQRSGRFGREVPHEDVQHYEAHEREEVDYVIDPDAVAAAILERLVAGRTFPTLPPKP